MDQHPQLNAAAMDRPSQSNGEESSDLNGAARSAEFHRPPSQVPKSVPVPKKARGKVRFSDDEGLQMNTRKGKSEEVKKPQKAVMKKGLSGPLGGPKAPLLSNGPSEAREGSEGGTAGLSAGVPLEQEGDGGSLPGLSLQGPGGKAKWALVKASLNELAAQMKEEEEEKEKEEECSKEQGAGACSSAQGVAGVGKHGPALLDISGEMQRQKSTALGRFVYDVYVPHVLCSPIGQLVVYAVFAGLLAAGIYGCATVDETLDVRSLITEGTQLYNYLIYEDK